MFGNYTSNPYMNNPYAVQYQPQVQQPIQQPQNTPQPISNSSNGIIWVQGESGAKGYLIAPNTSLLLMDSEGDYFYIKTTDNTGMPTLRKFAYNEITGNTSKINENSPKTDFNVDLSNYITRDELNEELAKLKPQKAKTKKEVEEDGK